MKIAATADIHAPYFFEQFVRGIEEMTIKPDIFLLAGDIVHNGRVEELPKVYNALFGKVACPIIATFGNNEFGEKTQQEMRKITPEITFLQDESITLDIGSLRVGIVGSIGSIEWPTAWQKKNFPNVKEEFENRIEKIKNLLQELKADFKILMLHYAPTFKILEGENVNVYPALAHRGYEKVIVETRPDLVVCGHSHHGKKLVWIDTIPIFNVSLPLNGKIVVIDTERDIKPGLERFMV